MIHDIDHTGVPNMQLVKEKAHVAVVYKNRSVAEQNSFDLAWGTYWPISYRVVPVVSSSECSICCCGFCFLQICLWTPTTATCDEQFLRTVPSLVTLDSWLSTVSYGQNISWLVLLNIGTQLPIPMLQSIRAVVLATDIFDKDMKAIRNSRFKKAFNKEKLESPLSLEDEKNLKTTIVIEYIMQVCCWSTILLA